MGEAFGIENSKTGEWKMEQEEIGHGGREDLTPRGDKQRGSHFCNLCGRGFSFASQLSRHLRIHQAVKLPSCSVCRKPFALKSELRAHLLDHGEDKPYKCHECGRGFKLKSHLKSHLVTHTGAKPHKCPICGKDFSLQTNLTKHLLLHRGLRPFSCDVCRRSFTQKAHLEGHILVHTGIKPHLCEVCGKSFSKRYHLKRHVLTHARVAEEEAPVGDPLMNEASLDSAGEVSGTFRIRRSLSDVRRHLCELCGKRFKKRYHLNRHRLIHGKVNEDAEGNPLSVSPSAECSEALDYNLSEIPFRKREAKLSCSTSDIRTYVESVRSTEEHMWDRRVKKLSPLFVEEMSSMSHANVEVITKEEEREQEQYIDTVEVEQDVKDFVLGKECGVGDFDGFLSCQLVTGSAHNKNDSH